MLKTSDKNITVIHRLRHIELFGRAGPVAPYVLSALLLSMGGIVVMCYLALGGLAHLLQFVATNGSMVASDWKLLCGAVGAIAFPIAYGSLHRVELSWWVTAVTTCAFFAALKAAMPTAISFFLSGFTLLVLIAAEKYANGRPASVRYPELRRLAKALIASLPVVFLLIARISGFSLSLHPPDAGSWFVGGLTLVSIWSMLRPPSGKGGVPSAMDTVAAHAIVRANPHSDAGLTVMGDKSYLFSQTKQSFLAYAKYGRTWVALYDPIGPESERGELIMAFISLARRHSGRAAFYQVRPESLPQYLDAGLTIMKVGEDASIDLHNFGTEGGHRSHLRYALRRGQRDAIDFMIVPQGQMSAMMPALKTISDKWLDHRSAQEKSFSVAAFDERFISSQSAILIRKAGVPIAFSTFMTTDAGTDATVGVMRHVPEAPPYTMEFLFTELSLHLKSQGVARLSLGVAPFSGMECSKAAALWHRLGQMVWRYGDYFYNFKGLRRFKEKFCPDWTPRYLAATGVGGIYAALLTLPLITGGKRS